MYRTVKEVQDVLSVISSCVPDPQLCVVKYWCHRSTDVVTDGVTDEITNCLVYRSLVGYALDRAFQLHSDKLFNVPEILAFLRPQSNLDGNLEPLVVEGGATNVVRLSASCRICGNWDFGVLIPEQVS